MELLNKLNDIIDNESHFEIDKLLLEFHHLMNINNNLLDDIKKEEINLLNFHNNNLLNWSKSIPQDKNEIFESLYSLVTYFAEIQYK